MRLAPGAPVHRRATSLVLKVPGDLQINDGTQKPGLMLRLSRPQLAFLTLSALARGTCPAAGLLFNGEPVQSSGAKAIRSESHSKRVSDKQLISKAVQRISFLPSTLWERK